MLTSSDTRYKKASETRNVLVDFSNTLDKDTDETIVSVSSVTASGLTISNAAVTLVTRNINGRIVPAGKAISFTVAGGTNGTDYAIAAVVVTSGNQTIDRTLPLIVRAS